MEVAAAAARGEELKTLSTRRCACGGALVGQYLGRISFSAVRVETWAKIMQRPDSDGYY
jgi:hypothetical protein